MKRLHYAFLILTIIWMAVIFIFSSQNGDISSNTSDFITGIILDIFVPDFDSYTVTKQAEILDITGFIVRKCAHFTEYAILAIFAFMTVLTRIWSNQTKNNEYLQILRNKRIKLGAFTLLFSVIYAISDEFHQGFVDGRAPALQDVLIDSCGSMFGILSVYVLVYMILRHKQEKIRIKD